ncbi:MAG: phosphate/phosphite/phosphonate ABC transporter substrate-binding protein [Candidatus Eremiobacteraeota bacterium]|nr:phosphate/phosphite/phosphonate ABC transporter substrate-binding protein [Candidatus Eremiobacteraeota bacterium]
MPAHFSPSRRAFIVSTAVATTSLAFPARGRAADELRVAVVPEVATTANSVAQKQPLVDLLQHATGRSVRVIVPTNYAATVEALGNDGVDLAHFGGLTYVKANARYGARALVQRIEDKQFHSLFIASAANAGLHDVAGLRGKNFAFGDVNSTSGHLIPAKLLIDAKLDPDNDIRSRFTGNHTATAIAVAAGQVDAGAIDETVYRKLVDDKTIAPAKARVFVTSEPFVDYTWAVAKSLDDKTAKSIADAFVATKDPALLSLLRATRYVASNDAEYDTIRRIAKRLNLL